MLVRFNCEDSKSRCGNVCRMLEIDRGSNKYI